ncbi:MAG TPA: prepilin peptidase [Chitinivibrionales bacterium]|nr:prepilin peptidase [Chitinivibrionales bacterium]
MNPAAGPFLVVVAMVLGFVLGSFFNVLIYRIPRHESIVWPGSHCPKCGRPIKAWENIPVLSFIFLRARCAGCGARISIMYPIVELCTAVAALVLYLLVIAPALSSPQTAGQVALVVLETAVLLLVIPVAVIDLFHLIIPDIITLPLLVLAVSLSFLPGGITPLQCGLGILAGGGSLFAVGLVGEYVFKKEAMGGGDIKLMAAVGAAFGWKIAILTIMFGAITGSLGGLAMIGFKKFARGYKIPFGPFLALGLWIAVLVGDKLVALYQTLLDKFIGS